jgi:hypothetical protein
MDRVNEMAVELESMVNAGEVDGDIVDEITTMVQELREGKKSLNEYYRASTPHKILAVLDEVNQRVKR